ncbi:hypothetical protein AG1IA_01526 [Rhizoctonia solani AG-1 IA]|uniref:Uncharacterized protein n=1 Tax=Thanatephorus cucumeris (strain AG1-IA) TaxID=983506 RepID=L8X5R7_THACA|nr:hypothetical protein AG1IA_01526 [Rhizoctonia solani AG-1 IA]
MYLRECGGWECWECVCGCQERKFQQWMINSGKRGEGMLHLLMVDYLSGRLHLMLTPPPPHLKYATSATDDRGTGSGIFNLSSIVGT